MHVLEPLPYDYNTLEPFIDEETMKLHHDKHHQTYVDKLNAALSTHPELFGEKVTDLLKDLDSLPDSIRTTVRNHGGGHVNHTLLWRNMKKGTAPHGRVLEAINEEFGSFENFKEKFTAASLSLFGSGWCWLVVDNGQLQILTTPNQDNPVSHAKIPVLGSDLWEHSYYVKYRSNRAAYVDAFYNVINWDQVEENYKMAYEGMFPE